MPAVSAVIIAQDEQDRIANAIRSCQSFADEVVVVDGGSRDGTVARARELGCTVFENPWPGYAAQRNYAASRATHSWIFFIDADEVVGGDLQQALVVWRQSERPEADAYAVTRVGDFLGRWLAASGGEQLVRLYNREAARMSDRPVHETLEVDPARVGALPGRLWHHGFRSIQDHVLRFNRYTDLEARHAHAQGHRFSLGRLIIRPPARFLQRYLFRRLYRHGVPGFAVAMLWLNYEFLVQIKLYELEWRASERGARDLPPPPGSDG
jgi:glycosyltransferase involved in cell wall biosynthesis